MTEPKKHWLVGPEGDYAQVAGAEQRDTWKARGWTEADEPTGNSFVWARQDGIAEPARFPAGALAEVWSVKGWAAAAPPDPVSPFNGDQLPMPAAAPLDAAAASKPTTAAGGNTKEK